MSTEVAVTQPSTSAKFFLIGIMLLHSMVLALILPNFALFIMLIGASFLLLTIHLLRVPRVSLFFWEHISDELKQKEISMKLNSGKLRNYIIANATSWQVLDYHLAMHLELMTDSSANNPQLSAEIETKSLLKQKHKQRTIHCYIWADSISSHKYRKLMAFINN